MWQLKEAELKSFSVLGVNIVKLDLCFQVKTSYGFLVVLLSLKL